jgi:hypothetical protein
MMLEVLHEGFGFITAMGWCREGFGGIYVADGVAWLVKHSWRLRWLFDTAILILKFQGAGVLAIGISNTIKHTSMISMLS